MNTLLLLSSAVLFLGLLNLWLWTWRRLRHVQLADYSTSSPVQLSHQVTALNAGAIGLGERLLRIEQDLKNLNQRLEQFELHADSRVSYTQAINLAKRGADFNELMEVCDLSRTEAELLVRMHQYNDAEVQQASHRH